MNRAFMKDPDDAARPEVLPERPQSPHPNYVTPSGLQRLRVQAADLAARLQEIGPSADPHERALLQRDLRWVEGRLQRAILVDPAVQAPDRVRFGMTVEVRHEDGSTEALTIVGEDEAEPGTGRISWLSPLAAALLDAGPGDEVTWQRPAGRTRLEILGVRSS
ncbi:GreA/GreB family elongation factor [Geothrix sp. 21YS21S-2]|uniref:GreA/GreB family elongation factor n=1 Tax=Geothrix sp. 21YS21S-2 TaxID=3068893 RepID=UPI0027BA8E81|nr:GreA/GreB family elongation factor [Geothrix sp. 21YS21S-2]